MMHRTQIFAVSATLCAAASFGRAQAPAQSLRELAPEAAPAAEPGSWDAQVTDYKGDVQIYTPGQDKPLPISKDLPLEEGDRIVTGAESTADIALDGGTILHISALSDFTLTNLDRSKSSFKLSLGTFLGKIHKLLSGQSLEVETPNAVAAVRGTEFGVEMDPAKPEETHTGVFDEGKVEVKGTNGAVETIIAGQETMTVKGQAPLHAYQLQRFTKYRSFVRVTMHKKVSTLSRSWKLLAPQERKALRQKTITKMTKTAVERQRKAIEKKQQRGVRQGPTETKQGIEQKAKMQKLKEQIRERGSHKK